MFLVDDNEDTKEAVVQSYANSYFEKKTYKILKETPVLESLFSKVTRLNVSGFKKFLCYLHRHHAVGKAFFVWDLTFTFIL